MGLARFVLFGSALAFAPLGAAFLVAPAAMGGLVDVALGAALADNDVRAVYGGLQLGCGVFLAWCGWRADPVHVRVGLVGQQFLFGGLVVARAVSWLAVGSPGSLGVGLHVGELAGLLLGAVALRRLPSNVGVSV